MDENINDKNINQGGKIEGFDSVNGETPEQGYTVTPDGGFYTKQKQDIIQDEVVNNINSDTRPDFTEPAQNNSEEQPTEPPKYDYSPNGSYTGQGFPYNQGFNNNFVKKPKEKKSHKYNAAVVVIASVLAAVIGAASGVTAVMLSDNNTNVTKLPSVGDSQSKVNINVDETVESVVEAVAKKVTPSVIGIRTTTSVTSFFGGNSESTGEGSGVIYSSDGYIITNYHVIGDAVQSSSSSKIEVFLDSKSSDSYPATVVGYNISSDLAVLKINVTGLTPIDVGDSSGLKVGQYVITVGSPGGLEFMGSVTYGVISGLDRVVSSGSNLSLIQTDAAINPGNSGGALVNTSGQLVGINSSKIVSEEFEGMGFAIPVNTVVEICKNIIEKQNDPEPYIGITISEKYTAEVLSYYGYPAGAVVLSVNEGSPAANAGLSKGDIITEFNGTEITEYSMLNELVSECTPKEKVSVKIYRSGRNYTTTITIGSNNAQ